MQAVILSAGRSTRTYPLTLTRPKPLLKVANKTLLEHNLDNLDNIAEEVIIVVGYKKNLIKKYIGNKYKNLKIKYVEQKQQLGTAHAVSLVEPYIKDRFLLLMGDDVYSKEDINNCIKHIYSILTTKTENPQNFGVVIEKNNILVDFVEKPKKFISNLASIAFYKLDKKIFKYVKKIKKSRRNEFEMPDAIKLMSKYEKIHVVKSKKWFPIVHSLDLLKADKELRNKKNIIGKNSKIYGKIKNSSVGNNCIVKGNVANSIIMDKTIIDKNSIIKDSIIGENVYLNGKVSNSVVADNVKARNVIIKNCKIWPDKTILNKTIKNDVQ
ncbi:MAG: sugar phosphate nucleotidyltransferase [Nanoarchaeota archaeon]|nr:sugar phosphate nucleotidyltransferase [Nanoarchaeota archaeon]